MRTFMYLQLVLSLLLIIENNTDIVYLGDI
jgi:hypothetical protein